MTVIYVIIKCYPTVGQSQEPHLAYWVNNSFIGYFNPVSQGSSPKRAERIDEIDPSNLTQIILAEGKK
jgi:hypothetical protein